MPFQPFENEGTGWLFETADVLSLQAAVGHAIATYRNYPDSFRQMQVRCMKQDLAWGQAAIRYEDELQAAKYTW